MFSFLGFKILTIILSYFWVRESWNLLKTGSSYLSSPSFGGFSLKVISNSSYNLSKPKKHSFSVFLTFDIFIPLTLDWSSFINQLLL